MPQLHLSQVKFRHQKDSGDGDVHPKYIRYPAETAKVRIKPSLRGGVVAPGSPCPAFIHSSELFLKPCSTGAMAMGSSYKCLFLPAFVAGLPLENVRMFAVYMTMRVRRCSGLETIENAERNTEEPRDMEIQGDELERRGVVDLSP